MAPDCPQIHAAKPADGLASTREAQRIDTSPTAEPTTAAIPPAQTTHKKDEEDHVDHVDGLLYDRLNLREHGRE